MKLLPLLTALTLTGVAVAVPAQTLNAPPTGRWVTESGNLEIDIAPCGDVLCGVVVKVLGNRSMSGPGTSAEPADPRPALGMEILSGLRNEGSGEYGGRIYNRENAKHYSVKLSRGAADQLMVRAYVGLPLFGKTQLWRRAELVDAPAPVAVPAAVQTATPVAPPSEPVKP